MAGAFRICVAVCYLTLGVLAHIETAVEGLPRLRTATDADALEEVEEKALRTAEDALELMKTEQDVEKEEAEDEVRSAIKADALEEVVEEKVLRTAKDAWELMKTEQDVEKAEAEGKVRSTVEADALEDVEEKALRTAEDALELMETEQDVEKEEAEDEVRSAVKAGALEEVVEEQVLRTEKDAWDLMKAAENANATPGHGAVTDVAEKITEGLVANSSKAVVAAAEAWKALRTAAKADQAAEKAEEEAVETGKSLATFQQVLETARKAAALASPQMKNPTGNELPKGVYRAVERVVDSALNPKRSPPRRLAEVLSGQQFPSFADPKKQANLKALLEKLQDGEAYPSPEKIAEKMKSLSEEEANLLLDLVQQGGLGMGGTGSTEQFPLFSGESPEDLFGKSHVRRLRGEGETKEEPLGRAASRSRRLGAKTEVPVLPPKTADVDTARKVLSNVAESAMSAPEQPSSNRKLNYVQSKSGADDSEKEEDVSSTGDGQKGDSNRKRSGGDSIHDNGE